MPSPPTRLDYCQLVTIHQQGENQFYCEPTNEGGNRMFGGHLLAVALRAATATVATPDDPLSVGKQVHSLHGYFLRPGAVDVPVSLTVDRVRDGRSFSARAVTVSQRGKALFQVSLSFQIPEPGLEFTAARRPTAPPPEQVTTTYDDYCVATGSAPDRPAQFRPVDIRYINPPSAKPLGPVTESQKMWMRITTPLPTDPASHAQALAYLSDTTLVDHALLPHNRRGADPDIDIASLDHAMWFHRPCRADQWLLFDQHIECTGGARGLASGRFFTEAGELVATCLQEGLLRSHH